MPRWTCVLVLINIDILWSVLHNIMPLMARLVYHGHQSVFISMDCILLCTVVCVIGLYIMCDIIHLQFWEVTSLIKVLYSSETITFHIVSFDKLSLAKCVFFFFYLCANVFCLVQPLLFKECDTATICTPLLSSNTWLLWQKHKHRRAFPVDGLAASKKGLNVTSKFPSSVSSSSHHQPRPNVIILLYNSISFFPLLLHCRQIV